ncbi:MAG TPA: tripartite tricarboxylate transporter substrate binding protein, partial [Burkholderiaceae bacterium]|nr:tripartite tricarboxylate transporter substrate binding protein [Burkholderiaceae bacterium]
MTHHPTLARRHWLAAALALSVAAAVPQPAAAQAFPSKTMTFVIPFAAGSATDQLGRALGRSVSEQTGQPVVVENKGGA